MNWNVNFWDVKTNRTHFINNVMRLPKRQFVQLLSKLHSNNGSFNKKCTNLDEYQAIWHRDVQQLTISIQKTLQQVSRVGQTLWIGKFRREVGWRGRQWQRKISRWFRNWYFSRYCWTLISCPRREKFDRVHVNPSCATMDRLIYSRRNVALEVHELGKWVIKMRSVCHANGLLSHNLH